MIVDKLELATHQTKMLVSNLSTLGVTGSALLLDEPIARNLELATRNLPECKVGLASGVNIVDLLQHDWIVMTEAAAKKLQEVLAS